MKSPAFSMRRIAVIGLALLLVLLMWTRQGREGVPVIDTENFVHKKNDLPELGLANESFDGQSPTRAKESEESLFSPAMEELVQGIRNGRALVVKTGDEEHRYLFRSIKVTTEDFAISSGPDQKVPCSFEVFEGRRIMADGSLNGKAALAVVNDAVSMAYSTEQGDFLIERNEDGQLVCKTLTSYQPGSSFGQFGCIEVDGMAGAMDLTGDSIAPEDVPASIILAAEADEPPPETASAAEPTDHSYFRLGPLYDASLKDIRILMVSGSTQTGSISNLSSSAASYLTFAAKTADVYERQLGLRYQLQEMILIAQGSGQPDVEYDDSVTPNSSSGSDDITAVRLWCNQYRPQASYHWGHVQAWTLVNGSASGTIGYSELDSYGNSNYGISVNERAWHWEILIHELGHNCGATHTVGGAMNAISGSSANESFFEENAERGGYTAAGEIFQYMGNSTRKFIFGTAPLRNPKEMPSGVNDEVSTAANTPVTFNPLSNDLTATPLLGVTNILRLVEVGQIYPKTAGTASMSGDRITFTPASGFTGKVWFSYTLGGDVGNGGIGWLHSADVVVTVGGSNTTPTQSPSISTSDDYVRTDFSAPVRLNPLLNDEGKGRLWPGGVHVLTDVTTPGTAQSYSDGAFHLVSAVVLTGNGSVALEKARVTRNAVSVEDNTGYLVYTPGVNEPAQASVQYTVKDSNGNQATGMIYLTYSASFNLTTDTTRLVEREGRFAMLTFSRSGSTEKSEWVDFRIVGKVSLTGSNSDVALAGFDSFDGSTGLGRVTIPAGQSSAKLWISAIKDAVAEGEESLDVHVTGLQSLHGDPGAKVVKLKVVEASAISTKLLSQNFDAFPAGSTLASGWTNATTAPGVWSTDSGTTSTLDTGPRNDHTKGTSSGVYLYREATGNTNQQADLNSPTIDLSTCTIATFEFYYHMFGNTMGELRVDVYSGGAWHLDVMPALVGEQHFSMDDPWALARIDVSAYATSDFKVRFRGTCGTYYYSDMAIDDFAVGRAYEPPTSGPVIGGQPRSLNVGVGQSAYLSVVAQAYPSPTYQWKKNGVVIAGATRSVLHFSSASATDSAIYTCDVSSGSTVTSSAAVLHVGSNPDSDGDGINDTWERVYLGSLSASNGAADSDGDGTADFFEYLHGSLPNNSSSKGFQFLAGPNPDGSATRFAWQVAPGMVLGQDYIMAVSTNLGSWSNLPADHYRLIETPENGRRSISLELTHDYGSKVFLRLESP